MKYSPHNLREMILKCREKDIPSHELGNWAYDGWFYYTEEARDEKPDKEFVDALLEISSEWGMLTTYHGDMAQFPKDYLEAKLKQIERFLNIEEEGDY
jgi:hypothetical protein